MHRSKLIPILRSLSKEELKEFDKYLSSPFFEPKNFVVNFFRQLSKFHPNYHDEDIRKESLFEKVYKGKKYNDGLVRRIVSDLIRAAEEYLTYKNFRNNDIFRNASLLNELRSRGLSDSFRVRSESVVRDLEQQSITDARMLLNSFFVNLEIKEFRTSLRDERMHEANDQMAESMTVFFLRNFFSYINHIRTFKRSGKAEQSIPLLLFNSIDVKKLMESLEGCDGNHSPYVKMIIYNYKLVNDRNDTTSYRKIRGLLSAYPEYFSEAELKNIYVNISKFFNFQNNLNSNKFLKETYELYELFLSKYYQPSTSLTLQLSFCRNYINVCRTTGNTERIKKFKEKYADNFPAEHRQNLELLCHAVYEFEKGHLADALKAASAISFQQPVYAKDVRILKIKCMYELGYIESLRNETDNLKHFLTSSASLTTQSVKRGRLFASLVLNLLKAQSSKDPAVELMHIRKRLSGSANLNEFKWLSEKVDSMLK